MFLIYLGILLLSSATLLFEITLTRVFSVAQWYHFAFMVVSLALLGFGASGSLLSVFPRLGRKRLDASLALFSIGFSATVLVGYILVNVIPFDSFRVGLEGRQLLYLVAYYVSLAIPFFFTGLALGVALSRIPANAGKVYGFNMIGSGLGCLLVLIGPSVFGGGGTVILACLLGLAAAFLFWLRFSKALAGVVLASGAGLIVLLFNLPSGLDIKMSPYKSMSQVLLQPEAQTVWSRWNAFSRVDVIEGSAMHAAPGLSLAYGDALPPQTAIAVDGEDLSPISKTGVQEAAFTEYLPTALAYHLSPGPRALIIEPQGGLDLLSALHHGSASVVSVVSNPLVVEAARRYGQEGSQLFSDARVQVVTEGARSYLRRSREPFDVVQLSLTDSLRVVVAGSYSLSESYLYTVEAFKEYYRHLAPQGVLSVTRWIQLPPSQGIRLASLAVAALDELGVAEPERHVVAIRTLQTITLLVKQSPVTPDDVEVIRRFCEQRQFDMVYFPGIGPGDLNRYGILPHEVYHEAFNSILFPSEREGFLSEYAYDVSATSDDRPFFFHSFKWGQVPSILESLGKTWQPFGGFGFLVVVVLLATAMVASVVFILLPLAFGPRSRRGTPRRFRWRVLGYFGALGIGYLFIEIPLMQRFILFVDQPTYSFAVVLFTILVCSGLGSLASDRLARVLPQAILVLALLTALYPLILSSFFGAALGLALPFRLLVSVGILAPLSFLMGIPFPLGVKIVGDASPELIPWAWGINGCASVVASVLAMVLALSFGFSWVLVGAAAAYLAGVAAMFAVARGQRASVPPGEARNAPRPG